VGERDGTDFKRTHYKSFLLLFFKKDASFYFPNSPITVPALNICGNTRGVPFPAG